MLVRRAVLRLNANSRCFAVTPVLQTFRLNTVYAKESFQLKPFSWDKQSVLLPGKERIRASIFMDDPNELLCQIPGSPQVKTVFDCLTHGRDVSGDGDCIGTKDPLTGEYKWTKYSEVITRAQHIGSGFLKLGLKPSNDTYISMFALNREEFLLTLYACAAYSMVLVPLYPSIGLDSICYIINQAQSSALIVNNAKNALQVLQNLKELPSVKTLIMMDKITLEVSQAAKENGINLHQYSDIEALGKKNTSELILPNPDDLFIIPYTSGTTGTPKGVMVSHKNLIAGVASLVVGYGNAGNFGGTIISYLPPAHIYEIVNEIASLYFARRIAFFNDDVKNLMKEVRNINPTILPLVPRLMNAIYASVMSNVKDSFSKTFLLKLALSRKEKLFKKGITTKNSIWDKLVFKKFHEAIGKDNHMILTTSAPLSEEITRFFRCASGSFLNEAYGQTEVLACVMTLPKDSVPGHVGPPLPSNHIKLVDVPDMGYYSKDDFGEVCVKGPNVFSGYFKNEKATQESLIDGWQHTGDIGRWLPNGTLKIIDRKKHLFKLQQGEYIAPEKVENIYSASKLVSQIFVDGLSDKDFVIAFVVPDESVLKSWAKGLGYKGTTDLAVLTKEKEVRKKMLIELRSIGSKKNLISLEQAKNLTILPDPFTVENELLSPTFKLRRNHARKHFEKQIREMYAEGPLV